MKTTLKNLKKVAQKEKFRIKIIEKNTGTIKENKALELGVAILTREELEEMIF